MLGLCIIPCLWRSVFQQSTHMTFILFQQNMPMTLSFLQLKHIMLSLLINSCPLCSVCYKIMPVMLGDVYHTTPIMLNSFCQTMPIGHNLYHIMPMMLSCVSDHAHDDSFCVNSCPWSVTCYHVRPMMLGYLRQCEWCLQITPAMLRVYRIMPIVLSLVMLW